MQAVILYYYGITACDTNVQHFKSLDTHVVDVAVNLAGGKSFVESLKPTSTWADYGSEALGERWQQLE
ncbi:MAG: hypothetical protein IJB96_09595 [Lachnospira sp.]|nr:hypothetical protein [Lachnospira sp.]